MGCDVVAKGLLANCKVLAETPLGAGFGDAALQMAPLFQMAERTSEGEATEGGYVSIPLVFSTGN